MGEPLHYQSSSMASIVDIFNFGVFAAEFWVSTTQQADQIEPDGVPKSNWKLRGASYSHGSVSLRLSTCIKPSTTSQSYLMLMVAKEYRYLHILLLRSYTSYEIYIRT